MFEFVGAAVGRSVMIEGTINSVSMINSILGMFMISFVSSKTQEDPLIYLFVMFKFSLFWLMISSVLGSITYCWQKFKYGKIQVDVSPRTRAWYEGPHLSPWMRATREVGSIILSFLPLLPEYQHMIEKGIGYFRLYLLLSSLWVVILVSDLYQERWLTAPIKRFGNKMILISFLIGYVLAQQTCINLQSDSVCGPSFQGAPVLFSNMDEFNENIRQFSNASIAMQQIDEMGGCSITQDDVLKQQYQISFFCSFIVADALSNNCSAISPYVPANNMICSNVCDSAKNSVAKGLSSCQKPKSISGSFESFCSSSSVSDGSCFKGVDSEIQFCGFRDKDAAASGCPSLRENELGTECCKAMFPGIVFLPLEQEKAIPLSIGIGIAVGVGAFLILALLLGSCVWCVTPNRTRPASVVGNSLLKNDSKRESISTVSSDSSHRHTLAEFRTPNNNGSALQVQSYFSADSFASSFDNASSINFNNPHYDSKMSSDHETLDIPATNYREAAISQLTVPMDTFDPKRHTIDLDNLEDFSAHESQSDNDMLQNNTQGYAVRNGEPVAMMIPGNTHSIYSKMLVEQYKNFDASNGNKSGYTVRNHESIYSKSPSNYNQGEDRDSKITIKFPSPPQNPPRNNN